MWSVYMYLSSMAHLSFLSAIFILLEVSTNFCGFASKVTTTELFHTWHLVSWHLDVVPCLHMKAGFAASTKIPICMFNGKARYARAFIKVFLSLFNCHIMLLWVHVFKYLRLTVIAHSTKCYISDDHILHVACFGEIFLLFMKKKKHNFVSVQSSLFLFYG